jgi:DNA adenine methylase
VEIRFGDAIEFLTEKSTIINEGFSFVYVDPPYYMQGKKLYRHSYVDADHTALAKFIRSERYPWLLSYDDHPKIRELYSANQVQPVYLDYKVKSNRKAQELVISNLVIPPPVYEGEIIKEVSFPILEIREKALP